MASHSNSQQASRTIIIGDVHGCLDEMEELLDKLKFRQGADELIFVGDLVGKGPHSVGVVKRARALGASCVLGNWDEFILENLDFMAEEHKNIHGKDKPVPHLSPADLTWFRSLPYYIQLPKYNAVVVHAGFLPGIPYQMQSKVHMTKMRDIEKDGTAIEVSTPTSVAWAKLWPGPVTVIFGHDAKRGFQHEKFAIGLDTGCVYGKKLTAYVLPSKEFVSVEAHKMHSEPKDRKRRGVFAKFGRIWKKNSSAVTFLLILTLLTIAYLLTRRRS
jgi:diadenosine tetraphosphatase ApaH/serine/threonine PP2A family protein phosphatase